MKKPEFKKPDIHFNAQGLKSALTELLNKAAHPTDKGIVIRLVIGAMLFILSCLPFVNGNWTLAVRIIALLLCGYDLLIEAAASVMIMEILVPKVLGVISAVTVICVGRLDEALLFVLIFRAFELISVKALDRSRQLVEQSLNIRVKEVRLLSSDDKITVVPVEQVRVGDLYMVNPGDVIPLDGFVVSGTSELDVEPLTGETASRKVAKDSAVLSGCINVSGVLGVRVTADWEHSISARRSDYVEKFKYFQHKIDSDFRGYKRMYGSVACVVSLLVAIVPPILMGNFPMWIHKGAMLLALSSPVPMFAPCAVTYYSAVGYAARHGMLLRNKDVVDKLTDIERVIIDKNGALSTGRYSIQDVESDRLSSREVIDIAAYAFANSNSSEARTVLLNAKSTPDKSRISNYYEDNGVCCIAQLQGGVTVSAGSGEMLAKLNIDVPQEPVGYTYVYVCIGHELIGRIVMADRFRGDVPRMMRGLRKLGIEKIGMISSDSPETGAELAQELKIDETYHARNEAEKAEVIAAVRKSMEESGGYLAYVNNGYEDMGALTSPDLGIALNGLISAEAMKSSNILLIKNEASRLSAAIKLAMNVHKTIKTNIIIMGVVTAIMAFLAVFGVARLWTVALVLGVASVVTALNATRYDTSTAANVKHQ